MAENEETSGFTLSSSTYDLLKKIVQIVLPGLGALYFTVASIVGLPGAEQVVGVLAAVAVFGGLLLGLSSKNYSEPEPPPPAGSLAITGYDQLTGHPDLQLTLDPTTLDPTQDQVTLNLNKLTDEEPPPLPPAVSDDL